MTTCTTICGGLIPLGIKDDGNTFVVALPRVYERFKNVECAIGG